MSDIQILSRFQGMVHNFDLAMGAEANKELRVKLIQEEAQEFVDAAKVHNIVEAIDGFCDLLYVLYGAAHVLKAGALAFDNDPYENTPVTDRTPDWVKVNSELEEFNSAVSSVIDAIRTGTPERMRIEMKDLVEGIWSCGAQGLGVDLKPFFEEVHRTNMRKLQGPKREDGKQLKPEGWKPPRIEAMYHRWCVGLNPHCNVLAPIFAKEHRFDMDNRLEHPDGGYLCGECGGLFVAFELDFGEDIKRGKVKNPYEPTANG